MDTLGIRYGVHITTWGMTHYYGVAWKYDGTKEERSERVEKTDLEKTIGESDAKYLNRIDETMLTPGFRWKPGMKTNRFNSEQEVIDFGVSYLRQKYGDDITCIERGDYFNYDNSYLYNNPLKGAS